MMFRRFKIKNTTSAPVFWKNYEQLFGSKLNTKISIQEAEFVVIDTETNGLNPQTDKILSIGAVKIDKSIIRTDSVLEIFIKQEEFNSEAVKIHGILQEGNLEKVEEKYAIEKLLHFIGNRIIIGHSIDFDIAIINQAISRFYPNGKLLNKSIDTIDLYKRTKGGDYKFGSPLSLDFIANEFRIRQSDRHNAAGDAFITAILFLKLISILKKRGILTVGDLLKKRSNLFGNFF